MKALKFTVFVYALAKVNPGWLSNLITMLRHSMAAISEIGDFRTPFVFFIFYSVLLALCTHKSIGVW